MANGECAKTFRRACHSQVCFAHHGPRISTLSSFSFAPKRVTLTSSLMQSYLTQILHQLPQPHHELPMQLSHSRTPLSKSDRLAEQPPLTDSTVCTGDGRERRIVDRWGDRERLKICRRRRQEAQGSGCPGGVFSDWRKPPAGSDLLSLAEGDLLRDVKGDILDLRPTFNKAKGGISAIQQISVNYCS